MNTVMYKDWECSVDIQPFAANDRKNKCIMLNDIEDGLRVAKVNVYLDGLKPNQVAIDINNCGLEIIEALQKAEIIENQLVNELKSGYCTYPVYELNPKLL